MAEVTMTYTVNGAHTLTRLLKAVLFECPEAKADVENIVLEIERQGMDRVPEYTPLVDAMRAALSQKHE